MPRFDFKNHFIKCKERLSKFKMPSALAGVAVGVIGTSLLVGGIIGLCAFATTTTSPLLAGVAMAGGMSALASGIVIGTIHLLGGGPWKGIATKPNIALRAAALTAGGLLLASQLFDQSPLKVRFEKSSAPGQTSESRQQSVQHQPKPGYFS